MALRGAPFGEGRGPIFLDELQCTGEDSDLLLCKKGSAVGRHHCDHSQDVGIRCPGNNNYSVQNILL